MAMYRVHRRLSAGKGKILYPGTLSRLEWLDETGLARLTIKGSISRVHAPPLVVLSGWRNARAGKIREVMGINDAEQLLEAQDAEIAEKMGVQPATVARWKGEVLDALMAKPTIGG